ncbi:MAG: TIGR01777 family protein [Kangiellaceae bacterium]|nr:TIGR01777 family protein [Kangiellaceae bacterium]
MQSVLITGGTGFIGRNLIPLLQKDNYKITVLSRNPALYQQDFFFQHIDFINDLSQLNSVDIVINLVGENLSNKRWSKEFKNTIKQSRIENTIKLVDWMQSLEKTPHTFISGSAIGFYGVRGNEDITENSDAGYAKEFQVRLCQDWEASALRAQKYGIRTCIIRTGVVLGNDGALPKMLLPFKLGLGGKLGNGQQYFSWIHIQDHIAAIKHLINNNSLSGAFNLTAPNPVTNEQLTKTLGKIINRPTFANMPAFALKVIMGEMAEILLTGQKVIPKKLQQSGFEFRFTDLEEALKDIIL